MQDGAGQPLIVLFFFLRSELLFLHYGPCATGFGTFDHIDKIHLASSTWLLFFLQVQTSVINHGRWNYRDRRTLLRICEYPAEYCG